MAADNTPMSKERKELLAKLAHITAEVYNGFICNWGPNGVPYADGRHFNYPCRFTAEKGKEVDAINASYLPGEASDEMLMTGHLKFGANHMPIYINMNEILCYLEKNYGLVVDKKDSS